MTNRTFMVEAQRLVADYANEHTDMVDKATPLDPEDVYIVWMCKTLQHNKALASTPFLDGMYYELTYNGDKHEMCLDVYKKVENRCIKM